MRGWRQIKLAQETGEILFVFEPLFPIGRLMHVPAIKKYQLPENDVALAAVYGKLMPNESLATVPFRP